jgi:hypothetical protein
VFTLDVVALDIDGGQIEDVTLAARSRPLGWRARCGRGLRNSRGGAQIGNGRRGRLDFAFMSVLPLIEFREGG